MVLALAGCGQTQPKPAAQTEARPSAASALDSITAAGLRANLSFLSSDAMRGRYTPSPELDIAAEFIASRFRAAGLEAPVNGSYFQKADLTEDEKKMALHEHSQLHQGQTIGQNVIGILRGSDPELSKTYIVISAHYDHIGTVSTAKGKTESPEKLRSPDGDTIFNGADDDGSGTVSVIALAQAFGRMKVKPKRSLVFMTFCGEELGLLGSRYYTEHPVVPLKDTVAEINLEQVGRTDGDIRPGSASLTGFDFTSIGELFAKTGREYGIRIYQDRNSRRYFRASDNLNFAQHGIPDHTICTAFEFPDYHGLKDEWQKINYENMAKIDKVVGAVVSQLAESPRKPTWNNRLTQTEPFRKAAAAE